MKEILTMGRYFKNKFGCKVSKVPIGLSGFTCPNIDGTVAKGGCTFCENESFSPNLAKNSKKVFLNLKSNKNPILEKQLKELEEQFYRTSKKLSKDYGTKKFIVYFQAFTNTYAPLDTLKKLYEKALSFPNVIGLSIGTRTDSINEETLKYLQELSKKSEIWIEYGIQTTSDKTLKKINRGHNVENIRYWIKKTQEYNLNICGHLIYGLPDETKEIMLNSFRETLKMGIKSIKIHPLYVVKNTLLGADYINGKFKPINEDDYIDVLVDSLKELPQNIVIQRITAGINDNTLLSPNWCKDKNQQMNNIRKKLLENKINY